MGSKTMLFPAAMLSALCLLPFGAAQEPVEHAKDAPPIDTIEVAPPELVSIEFDGGTVTALVKMVRESASKRWKRHVNMIVTGPADDVLIPALQIHDSEMGSLFEALNALVVPEYSVSLDSVGEGGEGAPILVVRVSKNYDEAEEIAQGQTVRVFPLRALTRALDGESPNLTLAPETVLTAVETALDLCKSGSVKPTIRFHQDSGLMFVQGTERQVGVAEEVIDRLREDTEQLRARDRALHGREEAPAKAKDTPGPSGPAAGGPAGQNNPGQNNPGQNNPGPGGPGTTPLGPRR